MEKIIRGLFQVNNEPNSDDVYQNWIRLKEYGLDFENEEDKKISGYIDNFFKDLAAPPDVSLIRDFFEKSDDIDTVSRIEEIKKITPYIKSNFIAVLKLEQERQNVSKLIYLLRDTATIAEHGKNFNKAIDGKKVLKGVTDSVNYIYSNLSSFTKIESGSKLEGIINHDAEEVIEEYAKIADSNIYENRNIIGLEPVDTACEGHKSGEFWVHCGYPGELKTTFALNYVYNNCYVLQKNMFYAILEMPYQQLRKQLYVIHSSNGKFVTEWYREDLKNGLKNPYMGIDYRKVRDGKLNELERKRFEIVAQDFKETCKGNIYLWRNEKAGVNVAEIQRRAEMFHNKYDCNGIIVDHMGLCRPSVTSPNETVAQLNAVVTECRWMALNFARGRSVPVLGLFHMNRQGKMRADKNDGRYDVSSISYANQIEKDADVITYTYLNDQLRKDGKFYLGNLKNRDNPLFDRMVGKIIWPSKRMRAIEIPTLDLDTSSIMKASEEIILDHSDLIT